jgi:hypothetical protein
MRFKAQSLLIDPVTFNKQSLRARICPALELLLPLGKTGAALCAYFRRERLGAVCQIPPPPKLHRRQKNRLPVPAVTGRSF